MINHCYHAGIVDPSLLAATPTSRITSTIRYPPLVYKMLSINSRISLPQFPDFPASNTHGRCCSWTFSDVFLSPFVDTDDPRDQRGNKGQGTSSVLWCLVGRFLFPIITVVSCQLVYRSYNSGIARKDWGITWRGLPVSQGFLVVVNFDLWV